MRNPLIYILFFCSGAAGLVYELVWVRELIFVFGGTTYAITTVLVAFMGGLGLGSYVAGRYCHRLQRPEKIYGLLEICIGLYVLAVPLLLSIVEPAYRALYPHVASSPWLLTVFRFVASALILIIPTTIMGATLPILVRYVTLQGGAFGRSVGRLYGINTLGAVVGVASAGFWLLPTFGLTATTRLGAVVNILIGLAARTLLRQTAASPSGVSVPSKTKQTTQPAAFHASEGVRKLLLVGFAVSGFAAMVYQITWTRALVMSLGSSTYAFTCILAAFILGLALGSLAIARWVDRWRNPVLVFGLLELIIGLVAVVIVPIHGQVPYMAQYLIRNYAENYNTLLAWQFLLVIAITFVPTFLMGAIFPLVTRSLANVGEDPGAATGRAYAINTIGTITGSFLAGFILIRSNVLGVQNSIVLASILNGLVGAALVIRARSDTGVPIGRRLVVPVVGLLLILAVGLGTGRWDRRLLNTAPYLNRFSIEQYMQSNEIKYFAEGIDLTVAVTQAVGNPDGLSITINGKPDASTNMTDMTNMFLTGHLPALINPNGKAACIVGLGSGMTVAAVACHPSYEHIDAIEISEDVIEAARFFDPYTNNALNDDPHVHIIRADGRNHLLLTDQKYDLILSEPPNLWMAGVSNLFTREYFELGQQRLADNGLMAVWLHSYSMVVSDFQIVIKTLFDVFDHVSLWELSEADYLMIASDHPQKIDLKNFADRFSSPKTRADLYRLGIQRPAQLLGKYIVSDDALRSWAVTAPIHTDDNALLEFSAPLSLYRGTAHDITQEFYRLQLSVLDELVSGSPPPSTTWQAEVANVLTARRIRVRAGEAIHQKRQTAGLRLLLEGYRYNPRDQDIQQYLRETPAALREKFPELKQLRFPVIAPVRGATLAQIASMHRQRAIEAVRTGQTAVAIDNLRQASSLEPDNLKIKLALAEMLVHGGPEDMAEAETILDSLPPESADTGRANYIRAILTVRRGDFDFALELLEKTMKSGQVPLSTITQNKVFTPISDDPRFKALLTPSPSETQPSDSDQP